MNINEAADRLAIQQLITAWTIGCDQGQILGSVWTEDAVLLPPGGMRIVGRENIVARFRGGRYTYTTRDSDVPVTTDAPPIVAPSGANAATIRHHLTTMQIELRDAANATGHIYVLMCGEDGLTGSGRYQDRYRKIDDRWYIAERKTRLEYLPPGERWETIRAVAAADREASRRGASW